MTVVIKRWSFLAPVSEKIEDFILGRCRSAPMRYPTGLLVKAYNLSCIRCVFCFFRPVDPSGIGDDLRLRHGVSRIVSAFPFMVAKTCLWIGAKSQCGAFLAILPGLVFLAVGKLIGGLSRCVLADKMKNRIFLQLGFSPRLRLDKLAHCALSKYFARHSIQILVRRGLMA